MRPGEMSHQWVTKETPEESVQVQSIHRHAQYIDQSYAVYHYDTTIVLNSYQDPRFYTRAHLIGLEWKRSQA